jgi:site-specific recombinase XerD
MKSGWNGFQSPLAQGIKAYLASKRALGKQFKSEEEALRLLDRYLIGLSLTNIADITPAILEAFLGSRSRNRPRSYNRLLGVVRRLFDWLVVQGIVPGLPLEIQARLQTAKCPPFIFNRSQARQLLDAAAELPDTPRRTQRGETYELAFLLMYGLGLRVGEVARLRSCDVDFDRHLLVIRQTKFAKSRLVPFGPRIEERIRTYLSHREQYAKDLQQEDPLLSFSKDKKKPLRPKSISRAFHELVRSLELTVPPGVTAPRAHHLRHSFAVGTLLRWYRSGINPTQRLIHLPTFLGHVDPTSTAVYLTITADLLQEANKRFERFAAPILKEIAL